jgi:hypothetical protein
VARSMIQAGEEVIGAGVRERGGGREQLRLPRDDRDQLTRRPGPEPLALVEPSPRHEGVLGNAAGVVEQLTQRDLVAVGQDAG